MTIGKENHLLFPPSAAQLYARVFWDPKATTSEKQERQLAYALGYPDDWRVERRVDYRDGTPVIRDRIHALFGKKKKSQYTWFHHEAAQAAAAKFEAEGILEESHLLPPVPLYAKGDVVQVVWEGKWFEATILKRKKNADSFLYSVYYPEDEATQDEIEEHEIRPAEDPSALAVQLGFTNDWKASRKGARYILVAPTGEKFTSKNAAMKFIRKKDEDKAQTENNEDDVGDPPWRTNGHEWIGRQVTWKSSHKVSGTRMITVDQTGTIMGFIKATDLDKEGNPGFVSEATGKPANLFHVVFPDEPHHLYASFLLNSQDLEEHEVEENLLDEAPAAKRKREAALDTAGPPGETGKPTPEKKQTPNKKRRRRS